MGSPTQRTTPLGRALAVVGVAFAFGAWLGVSCRSPTPTRPPAMQLEVPSPSAEPEVEPAPSVAPRAPVAPPPSPMCAELPSVTPLPRALAPAPPTAVTPFTVRCGERECNARTEVCCSINGSLDAAASGMPGPPLPAPACAPRVPDTGEASQSDFGETPWYQRQSALCAQALSVSPSLISLAFCDDSSDCPADRVCTRTHGSCGALTVLCAGWFTVDHCAAMEPLQVEQCVADAACRTPGTVCFAGQCVLRETARACGTRTCKPGSVCCWRREGCVECADRGACTDAAGIVQECYGPRDCPARRRCRAGFEYDSVGAAYYQGSSCEKGETELCVTVDDCLPDSMGRDAKECTFGALGTGTGQGQPGSPILGTCRYAD
jgi:hypothetical protein